MENNFRGEYSFSIDGKDHHALINMNCLRILCKEENMKFSDLDAFLSENPFDSVPRLVWYAKKNWLLRNGQEPFIEGFEEFCAVALDEPGLFEEMTSWVTESLGGEEQKKTRAARRKMATKR